MKKLAYILTFAFVLANFTACGSVRSTSGISSSTSLENSTASVPDSSAPEEKAPEGEPTFLTAPDGTPIYMSEITRYQDPSEFHGTHNQFPLDQFNKQTFKSRDILCDCPEIVCEGFAYAFIPRFNINYSEAPDKFEELDDVVLIYTGEPLPEGSDYFRLKVGDKFGGLTVKDACSYFSFRNAYNIENVDSIPGLYLTGAEIRYEGEVEMTGCIQILETVGYSTSGEMHFYPDSGCVSQIPAAAYHTEHENLSRGIFYGAAESWGSYGELSEITLGNMNDYSIDFDGLKPGDKNIRVKLTIKKPSITFKWDYMWCSGEPIAVTVIDI